MPTWYHGGTAGVGHLVEIESPGRMPSPFWLPFWWTCSWMRSGSLAGLAAVVVALISPGAGGSLAAGAPATTSGMAGIEQWLRTGQYEKARRAAEALGRRKGNGTRAAILAARAER